MVPDLVAVCVLVLEGVLVGVRVLLRVGLPDLDGVLLFEGVLVVDFEGVPLRVPDRLGVTVREGVRCGVAGKLLGVVVPGGEVDGEVVPGGVAVPVPVPVKLLLALEVAVDVADCVAVDADDCEAGGVGVVDTVDAALVEGGLDALAVVALETVAADVGVGAPEMVDEEVE